MLEFVLFNARQFEIYQETITKTVPSPNNTYTAIVTKSDQGALGLNTFVDVEYTKKVSGRQIFAQPNVIFDAICSFVVIL